MEYMMNCIRPTLKRIMKEMIVALEIPFICRKYRPKYWAVLGSWWIGRA